MAFSINDFKANGLVYQGARPHLFEIDFSVGDVEGINIDNQKTSFLISAASLPASTLDVIEVPYFGRRVKIFGERVFANWNVTVLNDEDFYLKSVFEAWSNKMNEMVGNVYEGPDLSAYKANSVRVIQYDKTGGINRSYIFNGLWPVNVDAIPLDWGRTNQIETFDVTFAVDYWVPDNTDVNSQYANTVNYNVDSLGR